MAAKRKPAQRARSLKSRQNRAAKKIARDIGYFTTLAADKLQIGPDTKLLPLTRLMGEDSAKRKNFPLTTGLLDYFPDACAAVAEVSYLGNQKHNPGQPMHHARGKSMDHADCIGRHLIERGGFDGPLRHSAALAWRALALLQEELEMELSLPLPRGAKI